MLPTSKTIKDLKLIKTIATASGVDRTELDRLLAEVYKDPARHGALQLRLIAADAAEEANLPYLAECLRWMAANNKYPWQQNVTEKGEGYKLWKWSQYNVCYLRLRAPYVEHVRKVAIPEHAILPGDVHPKKRIDFTHYIGKWYSSCSIAEQAFYLSWHDLREQGVDVISEIKGK